MIKLELPLLLSTNGVKKAPAAHVKEWDTGAKVTWIGGEVGLAHTDQNPQQVCWVVRSLPNSQSRGLLHSKEETKKPRRCGPRAPAPGQSAARKSKERLSGWCGMTGLEHFGPLAVDARLDFLTTLI